MVGAGVEVDDSLYHSGRRNGTGPHDESMSRTARIDLA
jgi:hypothetical protein